MRGEREKRGDAGQGGAAQQRADLVSETAGGDEHEALGALGELVEELHRHAAAERVPDDRGAIDAEDGEQVADRGGVCAERVVTARCGGVAVADQVGGDHGVAVGERKRDLAPVARGVDHAVDQHDRRTAADHVVDHAVTVQLDLPGLERVGSVVCRAHAGSVAVGVGLGARARSYATPPPGGGLCAGVSTLGGSAPVAQLDRASVYGTEGREFESLLARKNTCKASLSQDDVSDVNVNYVPNMSREFSNNGMQHSCWLCAGATWTSRAD